MGNLRMKLQGIFVNLKDTLLRLWCHLNEKDLEEIFGEKDWRTVKDIVYIFTVGCAFIAFMNVYTTYVIKDAPGTAFIFVAFVAIFVFVVWLHLNERKHKVQSTQTVPVPQASSS